MNRLSVWICVALGVSLLSSAGCRTREIELAARFGPDESAELLGAAALESKLAGASGKVTLRQLVTPHTKKHDVFPEVRAYLAVEGFSPGKYTLRLQDSGDCAAPATTATASPNQRVLDVGPDGKATLIAALSKATLDKDDQRSIIGKTFVLHQGADATGAPVACGVIAAVAAPSAHAAAGHGEGAPPAEGAHAE